MKTIQAVATTYRGTTILQTMSGFTVFGDGDKQYDFETRTEAEAFIDVWILTGMEVAMVGDVPMQ